ARRTPCLALRGAALGAGGDALARPARSGARRRRRVRVREGGSGSGPQRRDERPGRPDPRGDAGGLRRGTPLVGGAGRRRAGGPLVPRPPVRRRGARIPARGGERGMTGRAPAVIAGLLLLLGVAQVAALLARDEPYPFAAALLALLLAAGGATLGAFVALNRR